MLSAALLGVARRAACPPHLAVRLTRRTLPSVAAVAFRRNFADSGAKAPPEDGDGGRREDVDLDLWKSIASKSGAHEASASKLQLRPAETACGAGTPSAASAASAAAATRSAEDAEGRADASGGRAAPAGGGPGVLSAAVEVGGAETAEAALQLIALLREAGKSVPSVMTEAHVDEYLGMTSKSMRQRFLRFLYKRECMRTARKQKQEGKREERELLQPKEARTDEPLRNTFVLTFWSRTEERAQDWRLAQAMRFGQPLVIDMNYDHMMNARASRSCAEQIIELVSTNRRARDPFHLHLCSYAPGRGAAAGPEGRTACAALERLYGADTLRRAFVADTERSFLELFPRERLVYLTADSPNELRAFDHSAVYVVGGFVDLAVETGVSLGRAKRHGLATARLPLDRYLSWGLGGKNLTLDQVVKILDRVKDTGDWSDALQFVPRRKLKGPPGDEPDRGQQGQQGQHGKHDRRADAQRWGAGRPREGHWAQGRWAQAGEARGRSAGDAGQGGGGGRGAAPAKGDARRWGGDAANGSDVQGAKGHGVNDGFRGGTWQSKLPGKW